METMEPEEYMNHLLECQELLRTGDLAGWKRKYQPDNEPKTPMKKRRMSPNAVIWQPHPPCMNCGDPNVVEDVKEAHVVCIMCGLIQFSLIGTMAVSTNVSNLQEASPAVVHRYSKIVYFRSFILSMVGATEPQINQKTLERLRRMIDGDATKTKVHKALKQMNLLTKYRRHIPSLTKTLNPSYSLISMPDNIFIELLRLFRRVEFYWEADGFKSKFKNRHVFISYPYIFYQLCFHLNCVHLSGPHHLLKSPKLLHRLHVHYGPLAKKANLKCDLNVYRHTFPCE